MYKANLKSIALKVDDVQKLFNVTDAIIIHIEGKHLVFES